MIQQPGFGFSFSPASPVREFFERVYRVQNSRLMAGKARTLAAYRDQITHCEKFLAKHLAETGQPERPLVLGDLTDDLLAAVMHKMLEGGKAPATANKVRATIMAIATFARQRKKIPLEELSIEKLREDKRTPRAWMEEELQAILTAAGKTPGYVGPVRAGIWFSGLILFVLNTGCRITSVMRTPRKCLDLARGTVIVPAEHQKHSKDEPFPLTEECLQMLRLFRLDERSEGPPETIFGDWPHDRHRPAESTAWVSLNRRLRKIIVRAGLRQDAEAVTATDLWHKFRKTMASYVAARMGKAAAQQLLGHSDVSVTERYLDDRIVARPDVREALPKLVPTSPVRIVG